MKKREGKNSMSMIHTRMMRVRRKISREITNET